MSDEPTTMDWLLHITRGHTPTKEWERRNSLEFYFNADADEKLVKVAPKFRDEVIRLLEEVKRLSRMDETTSKYLSFALSLLTDEQDCEYTHFVGGFCTHDCCPHRGDAE
jgi:hypothetical protein